MRTFFARTDAIQTEIEAATLGEAVELFLEEEADALVRCGLSQAAAAAEIDDLREDGWFVVEDEETGEEFTAGKNPQHIA